MMSKNAPTRVQKLQRQAEALQLRIEGKTYDEIATILGISRATTFRYVAAGVSDLRMDVGKRKEELRNLQAARLESLVLALWPKVKIRRRKSRLRRRQRAGPDGTPLRSGRTLPSGGTSQVLR